MLYNVDDEPPLTDLKIFQWRGTTASSNTIYNITLEELMSILLYMYSNMEEMEPYFMLVHVVLFSSLVKLL
jgi:hypothetical protein